MTEGDSHAVSFLLKTLLKKNCYKIMTCIIAGRHSMQDWLPLSDRGISGKLGKRSLKRRSCLQSWHPETTLPQLSVSTDLLSVHAPSYL